MKKGTWGCIVIGMTSITLSVAGVFFPLDGFVGCNLPFQFLLLLSSMNQDSVFIRTVRLPFFDYVFSVILIASGIGTIWQKKWGKTFGYAYAIVMIIFLVIIMPMDFLRYILSEFFRISKEPSFMDWVIWGGALGYIFALFGALFYPIILLRFFSRPDIKKIFENL